MTYLGILFASVFLTNIMIYKLYRLPSVDKNTKLKDILIDGISKILIGLVATLIIYPINKHLLITTKWTFLLPLLVLLVTLNLTILTNFIIKRIDKFESTLVTNHQFLFLNSIIVAAVIVVVGNETFVGSIFEVLGFLLGHLLLVFVYYTMRPRLDLPGIPKGFKGIPIMLITFGLIAMVFLGLAGIL